MLQAVRPRPLLFALLGLLASLCCSLSGAVASNGHNWLAAHRDWRVGVVLQAPYAQINPRNHLLEGADVEVMLLLANKMGVQLSWRTFASQQALDHAVEDGTVDVAPGMLQTPASLHHWLFSQPYLRVPHKIVGFPDGSGNAVDLDRLSLNERLAVNGNSDALRFVRRNYPELPRVEVANDRSALQTVQQQYAEYAIVDEAQLTTLLKEAEFSRLAVVGDLGYTHLLRIGVRRDWPELPAVLDRQLQDIPGSRMEQLYARWMLPSYPRLIDSLTFWHRLSLALLLSSLLLAVVWNHQRRQRRWAEKRLLAARMELEARDLAEESLRLTQFSIDNSTVGILWVNWDSRIQYANRAAETMLGYPAAQLLRLSLPELQPSLDHARWLEMWNQLRSRKAVSSFETHCLKANGQALPVGVTLSFLKFGRTEYLVVYLNDITERQKARAALEESEARFKGMASNVPGMVFRLERPAAQMPVRLAFVSDASQSMLGYSPLDMISLPAGWLDVVAADDRSSYQQAWQQADQHNHDLAWQGRMLHQDGQLRWVDIKATVRCFDDGHVVWDGIVWDISENKHNELQLAESRGLLRSLSAHLESVREEEKARIAREVHDELGQILTVLRLETSMCELSFGHSDSKLAERLQAMKKLIEQTFQIVRDVATALRPPVLDAGIGSAIEWQARRFEKRSGIPCLISVPDSPIPLSDARAIGVFRILQEALTNVLRHAEASTVSVGLTCNQGMITLSIADDGKGFDPQAHRQLRSFGLVGIRERVLLLGGVLDIDSQPDQGCTLTIRLPAEAGKETA
ncbi:histidine kinase [Aquitalea sp. FJL05]|uniref:PAS domain-containing sensor histidine kinase n=1 Tax=Aquitalea sp. FJL05 TaxID=2153366 RepID=UPI000F5973B4|nr:transporter substrate-binding domain-containing protein [Aquitalea sp. FJL05]RQO68165.1 histidine kinase [Aquitalea sp. FJL05]